MPTDLNDTEEELVRGVVTETIAQLKNMREERVKSRTKDSTEYFTHAKIALGFVACYAKLRATLVAERMLEARANDFIETSSRRSKQKALR
jgi:hypothetical protein